MITTTDKATGVEYVDNVTELPTLLAMELPTSCDYCDQPTSSWPSNDCEEPAQHTTATYGCDCGELVTMADALARPAQHRRCHLIP